MFHRPAHFEAFPGFDGYLQRASADQLNALARYFEAQAKRLRIAAYAIQAAEGDQRTSLHHRSAAELEFLRMGARVAALVTVHRSKAAAVHIVQTRTGLSAEVIRGAVARWNRYKKEVRRGTRASRKTK